MACKPSLALALAFVVILAGCMHPDERGADPVEWSEPVPARAGCTDVAALPLPDAHPVVVLETTAGSIHMEVYRDLLPRLADHFLQHVEEGAYDSAVFDRIEAGGFMRAGFDASDVTVAEEFHHRLRPDAAGAVAMWREQAGEATSAFLITFDAVGDLEERYSVFAQVLPDSLPVLAAIHADAASADGTPREEIMIEAAHVIWPPTPAPEEPRLGLWTPRSNTRVGLEGGTSGFVVSVMNCAAHAVAVELHVEAPEDVEVTLPAESLAFGLGALQRRGVPVQLVVQGGEERVEVMLVASAEGAADVRLPLFVQPSPLLGNLIVGPQDRVRSMWLLMSEDGRVVATSYPAAAAGEGSPLWPGFNGTGTGSRFSFQPEGPAPWSFWGLAALGAGDGEVRVLRATPETQFGRDPQHPLAGRELFFLLDLAAVDRF